MLDRGLHTRRERKVRRKVSGIGKSEPNNASSFAPDVDNNNNHQPRSEFVLIVRATSVLSRARCLTFSPTSVTKLQMLHDQLPTRREAQLGGRGILPSML